MNITSARDHQEHHEAMAIALSALANMAESEIRDCLESTLVVQERLSVALLLYRYVLMMRQWRVKYLWHLNRLLCSLVVKS